MALCAGDPLNTLSFFTTTFAFYFSRIKNDSQWHGCIIDKIHNTNDNIKSKEEVIETRMRKKTLDFAKPFISITLFFLFFAVFSALLMGIEKKAVTTLRQPSRRVT